MDRVYEHWVETGVVRHKFMHAGHEKAIRRRLAELDAHMDPDAALEEIEAAIGNYATCLTDGRYRWTHRWTLDEFLNRGFHRFRPEAEPLKTFLDTDDWRRPAPPPEREFAAARGAAAFASLDAGAPPDPPL